MQRINPTDGVRIGALDKWLSVWMPTTVIDPISGGLVPGDPALVLRMFAAVEPFEMNIAREILQEGGIVSNVNQYVVTCWYQAGLSVAQFIEYYDGGSGRTRTLEIIDVRDQAENHRYQEVLCRERVS